MNEAEDSLAQAKAAAVIQRLRLRARLGATGDRLAPSRLWFDTRRSAKRGITKSANAAVGHVKVHPIAAGGLVIAALGWLFRKPIGKHVPGLLDRFGARLDRADDATWADVSGSLIERAKARIKGVRKGD